MISAIAKNAGDYYDVETRIEGRGNEVEAEVRSILEDFTDWCTEQIKEEK